MNVAIIFLFICDKFGLGPKPDEAGSFAVSEQPANPRNTIKVTKTFDITICPPLNYLSTIHKLALNYVKE